MKLVACVLLSTARLAHAGGPGLQDPANPITPAAPPPPAAPDPVVSGSSMHGVESAARHQGLNFTAALGGGLTVGVGIDSSVGRGPSASFRLAHMAGESWAFNAELATVSLLHQIKGTAESGKVRTDLGNNLLFGAQYYVNRVLWIRAGVGFGSFTIAEAPMKERTTLPVGSGVGGAGLDLVRWRRAALGVEMMTIGMITGDSLITTTSFMLDLSIESL